MTFFEISCEAHTNGATIYVVGLFGEIVSSRIERWVASLPDEIVNVRLDLRGVSFIDPASFVRVARALTGWRDAHGTPTSRRVNMEFPERSRHRVISPALATRPGAVNAWDSREMRDQFSRCNPPAVACHTGSINRNHSFSR